MKNQIKNLSLVIPCHNEADVIVKTLNVCKKYLDYLINQNIISTYEIVTVNNGSTDQTLNILKNYRENFKIKIVNLKKNYGYTSSYLAGLYHSNNDMIVSISADLHEDINSIKKMVQLYYKTNNPVLGVYKKRHATLIKNLCSKFYYSFMNLIGIKIVKYHADFRLISLQNKMDFFKKIDNFVFIRIKILECFDKFSTIEYIGNDRVAGKSKFNFFSSLLLAFDSIIFYSKISIYKIFNILILIKAAILITLNIFITVVPSALNFFFFFVYCYL